MHRAKSMGSNLLTPILSGGYRILVYKLLIFEADEMDLMADIQVLRQCGGPSDGRLKCEFRKEKTRE